MIVGVDSSGVKSDCLSVAMCATLDNNFTKYTNKKIAIDNNNKTGLYLPISTFIYESLLEYFKLNKRLPGGIIIYRQGVSIEQKKQLQSEVKEINDMLNGKENYEVLKKEPIPYYYILVNKKSSMKVFEIEKRTSKFASSTVNYINPDCGLLAFEGLVDNSIFEFYIQPQKVVSGCASPTHFHVAFGNLDCPSLIPKLTFDLCFLYSNWRGPVRVPAPLKYAEKLSKVLPKLHMNVKNSLCYV
jgi:aubergine-like protein